MPTLLVVETLLLAIAVPVISHTLMDAEVRRLSSQSNRGAEPTPPDRQTGMHIAALGGGIEARKVAQPAFVPRFGLSLRNVTTVHMLRTPAAFDHWPAVAQDLLRRCVLDGHFRGPRLARFVEGDVRLSADEAVYLAKLKGGELVAFVDRVRD